MITYAYKSPPRNANILINLHYEVHLQAKATQNPPTKFLGCISYFVLLFLCLKGTPKQGKEGVY